MKQTKQEILDHLCNTQRKNGFEVNHNQKLVGLLGTYTTKGGIKKAVFMCDELNRETFRKFCIIKNELNALRMTVYCEYAYYTDMSPLMNIVLNRDEIAID